MCLEGSPWKTFSRARSRALTFVDEISVYSPVHTVLVYTVTRRTDGCVCVYAHLVDRNTRARVGGVFSQAAVEE